MSAPGQILAMMGEDDERSPEEIAKARAENRWDVRPLERLEFGYTPTPPSGESPQEESRPAKARRRRPRLLRRRGN